MNVVIVTGFLMKAAYAAYATSMRKFLIFDAMLSAEGDAEPTPWRCEIEDPGEIENAEPLLTAGRGVLLHAELAGRPFVKGEVQSGYTRFLKVKRVQFVRVDRAKAAEVVAKETPEKT